MLSYFQKRVAEWIISLFGVEVLEDHEERAKRFLEEALELGQAVGVTAEDAKRLLDYVYGRPEGEIEQELGGSILTLLGVAESYELSLTRMLQIELERVDSPEIREKCLRHQQEKAAAGVGAELEER